MNPTALYTEQDMIEKYLASPGWAWQVKRAEVRLREYRNQLEVKRADEAIRIQGQVAELRRFIDEPNVRLTEIVDELKKGEKANG
jgi:hypothetical protein